MLGISISNQDVTETNWLYWSYIGLVISLPEPPHAIPPKKNNQDNIHEKMVLKTLDSENRE